METTVANIATRAMSEVFPEQDMLTTLHRDFDDAFPSRDGRCNDKTLLGMRTCIVGGRLGPAHEDENESGGTLFVSLNHVSRPQCLLPLPNPPPEHTHTPLNRRGRRRTG